MSPISTEFELSLAMMQYMNTNKINTVSMNVILMLNHPTTPLLNKVAAEFLSCIKNCLVSKSSTLLYALIVEVPEIVSPRCVIIGLLLMLSNLHTSVSEGLYFFIK